MRLPSLSSRWVAGGVTLAVWALAAGSALFWYLRTGSGSLPVQAQAPATVGTVPVDTRAVARMLGAPDAARSSAQAVPDVSSRLALRGVVTHQGRGAALISVDGKPPAKPLRVGAPIEGVDGGWAVQSVSPRVVVIAAGGREAKLEMPPLEKRSSAGDAVAPPRPAMPQQPLVPAVPPQPPQQPQPGVLVPAQPMQAAPPAVPGAPPGRPPGT